jgi:hypothetical protein
MAWAVFVSSMFAHCSRGCHRLAQFINAGKPPSQSMSGLARFSLWPIGRIGRGQLTYGFD